LIKASGNILFILIFSFLIYSCSPSIDGCTDPNASNYNSAATANDGSCIYARDRYIGYYKVTSLCDMIGGMIYYMYIDPHPTISNKVYLNKWHGGSTLVEGTIMPDGILYLDDQTGSYDIGGSGNLTGIIMNLSYTADNGSIVDSCTTQCLKLD